MTSPGEPPLPAGALTVPGNRWDLLAGRRPSSPPRVSVVVTHFEQPAQLRRTLAALARQTHPRDRLEVVVADDGSRRPPTVPAGVRLVRQEDRGFRAAAARNLGAAATTGEVLCFLDADTTPEPAYVERLTRLPALAPEIVVVGRREHADLGAAEAEVPVEELGPRRRLEPPSWLADGYAATGDLLDPGERGYRLVISSVLGCSRWLFDLLGGFDESFATYGGEDWEWADRAWRQGALLAHVADAVAWHDGPDWAGRVDHTTDAEVEEGDRTRRKNAETLGLVARGLPGLRPHALRLGPAVVEIIVDPAASVAALLVAVDRALDALPGAAVRLPAGADPLSAGDPRVGVDDGSEPTARVLIGLDPGVVVDPDALRDAVDRVQRGPVGRVRLLDDSGVPRIEVASVRARRRERRWSGPDHRIGPLGTTAGGLFETVEVTGSLRPAPDPPDLEAYLGGWRR